MARTYVEVLKDDLTGEVIPEGDVETIEFAVNGKSYTIDLTKKNAAEFHKNLDKYIAVAAKASVAAAKSSRPRTARTGKEQLSAIRAWAQKNGYNVSARGRISAEVLDAYNRR